MAASAIPLRNVGEMPRAMTVEEIHAFTHKMGQAARRAREAGVDAVEIHAAHRHGVLGTFLSPLSNKRVDDYGGSVDGRLRFLLEVIAEVRRAAGEDYPIIVRMSMTEFEPGGQSMLDAIYIARRLEKAGVSLLNLSNGTLETYWRTVTPNGTPRGVNTELSKQIKDAVSIPVGCIWPVRFCVIPSFPIRPGRAGWRRSAPASAAPTALPMSTAPRSAAR